VGNVVPAATLGALGALIASRRPENPIGWLMLFISTSVGVSGLAALVTIRALLTGASPHGWVRWTAWAQNWIGNPALGALILLIFGVVGLLVRLRRSRGEERQQLKWFAYAASVSVAILILAIPAVSLSPSLSNAMFTGAFSLGFAFMVPAAAALAILRYGLYE